MVRCGAFRAHGIRMLIGPVVSSAIDVVAYPPQAEAWQRSNRTELAAAFKLVLLRLAADQVSSLGSQHSLTESDRTALPCSALLCSTLPVPQDRSRPYRFESSAVPSADNSAERCPRCYGRTLEPQWPTAESVGAALARQ